MPRTIMALTLLSLLGLAFLPGGSNAEEPAYSVKPMTLLTENVWRCEPVLLFDVTGEGALGPYHLQYTIYNNGMVNYAREGYGDVAPLMKTTHIPRRNVLEIWKDLVDAKAFVLPDQQTGAVCMPMTSVTIFTGTTDSMAHTFNYWVPDGPYAAINRIIETAMLDPIG